MAFNDIQYIASGNVRLYV